MTNNPAPQPVGEGGVARRPVHCLFCKGQMYYEGEEKHQPEVCLHVKGYTLMSPAEAAYSPEYAHRDCFDAARATSPADIREKAERVAAAIEHANLLLAEPTDAERKQVADIIVAEFTEEK